MIKEEMLSDVIAGKSNVAAKMRKQKLRVREKLHLKLLASSVKPQICKDEVLTLESIMQGFKLFRGYI